MDYLQAHKQRFVMNQQYYVSTALYIYIYIERQHFTPQPPEIDKNDNKTQAFNIV